MQPPGKRRCLLLACLWHSQGAQTPPVPSGHICPLVCPLLPCAPVSTEEQERDERSFQKSKSASPFPQQVPETDLPRAKEKGVQTPKYNHLCRDRAPSSHLPPLGRWCPSSHPEGPSVGPSGALKRLCGGHLPGMLRQSGGASSEAPPAGSLPSGPEGPPHQTDSQ